MKKILLTSIIISAAFTLAGLITNLLTSLFAGAPVLAMSLQGGECVEYVGFGLLVLKIYPMMEAGVQASGSTHYSFEPISLAVSLVGFFILAFIILLVVKKPWKK